MNSDTIQASINGGFKPTDKKKYDLPANLCSHPHQQPGGNT